MDNNEKDWKLKLRYGKIKTAYQHFTIIAPVIILEPIGELSAKHGTAYIGMKTWAKDTDEATEIIFAIGVQTGFKIDGKIEVFKTDPEQPPEEAPYAYDINFSHYKK